MPTRKRDAGRRTESWAGDKNNGCHFVCVKYWSNYLKDTRHKFFDPQLPRNNKLYYPRYKTRFFFISEKNSDLHLWMKYRSIYLKYKINEFFDHKSPQDQKLHIYLGGRPISLFRNQRMEAILDLKLKYGSN